MAWSAWQICYSEIQNRIQPQIPNPQSEIRISLAVKQKPNSTSSFFIFHSSFLRRDLLLGLLLLLLVVSVYTPIWHAGFIWDDSSMLTANPCIIGPLGLKEIWTTNAADICPFTITTLWLMHPLWGLAPLPYHVMNILMHAR